VNTKRLFSIDEAATYIGISRVSIYRAANRGDIPLVKLGGRTLVEVSDLDAYIANHKTTAAASFTVTIKWPLSPNA
jgi:excisionase family DNA binding protein